MDDERIGIKLEAEWEPNEEGAKKAGEKDGRVYNDAFQEALRKGRSAQEKTKMLLERKGNVAPQRDETKAGLAAQKAALSVQRGLLKSYNNIKAFNPIASLKAKRILAERESNMFEYNPRVHLNRDVQDKEFRASVQGADSDYAKNEKIKKGFGGSLLNLSEAAKKLKTLSSASAGVKTSAAAASAELNNVNSGLSNSRKAAEKLNKTDAGSSKIRDYLFHGTKVANLHTNISRQKALVASLAPSQSDYTLAAKALNRGKWSDEGRQRVKDARERIKLYNQEHAALQRMEKDDEAPGGGLFSKLFHRNLKDKLGVFSSKNSIFDKKTISGNGLLPTTGYGALRAMEIGLTGLKKPLKSISGLWQRFVKRLGTRLLTNAVKAVIRLAKEGLKNLDQYSQHLGTPFHKNVLELSTSLLYLKNAFAAMVGPIANALTPALKGLMDTFANLANHIGAFFAAITGQSQFTAALRKTVTDTKNAAGKLLDILGFDEINRLSGDRGGSENVDEMFEEWGDGTIFEFFRDAIRDGEWELIGETLADKINGIIDKLSTTDLAKKIGEKIGGAITAANALVKKLDFKKMGTVLATWFNDVIGSISWQDLGELIFGLFSSAIDFFIGIIGNLDWGGISKAIGGLFTGIFDGAATWVRSVNWKSVGESLITGIVDFLANLPLGDLIAGAFDLITGVAKGAIELVGGILGGLLELLFPGFHDWFDDLKEKITGWMPSWLKGIFGIDKKESTFEITGKVEEEITTALDRESKGYLSGIAEKLGIDSGNGPLVVQLGGVVADWIKKILGIEDENAETTEKSREHLGTLAGWGPWLRKGNKVNFNGVISGGINGAAGLISGGSYLTFAASGGTFDKGQLFIANEAGPELIGNLNGKASVTNYDQFTQSVIDANSLVVEAVMQVVAAVNNKDFDVYMDSQKVGESVTQYQNSMARRFGY